MARHFANLDEFKLVVGTDLGTSDWTTITQEQINLFADATGDHQWIHVDPVRAADGPFGGTIAHGYLTLSLLPVLLDEVFTVDQLSLRLNYGTNKVRFTNPVPVDSRVRASVRLADTKDSAAGTQIFLEAKIEIEGAERAAVLAELVWLYAS